jgi:hypothetical protein
MTEERKLTKVRVVHDIEVSRDKKTLHIVFKHLSFDEDGRLVSVSKEPLPMEERRLS